jgi:endonuclease/exonuclease/phosphatase family metal-dependent hydrolase
MATKTEDPNDTIDQAAHRIVDGKVNDPFAEHWEARLNQPPIKDSDRNTIRDAESQSEGNDPNSGLDTDSPKEDSLYNSSQDQETRSQKFIGKIGSNKKLAGGLIGAFTLIIIGILLFFGFISTYQLVHLAKMVGKITDAQTERVMNRRVKNHYKIIFDEDGKGVYGKTGIRGRISKGYSSLDPQTLINYLNKKGVDIYKGKDGKIRLNGEILDGKLSDQRNRLTDVLREKYPQDRWAKRSLRSKTAFRAMGIKRVFFENTRNRYTNWELEMISRMRQKLGITDSTSTAKISGLDEDKINEQASDIRNNMDDPNFDPAANTEAANSSLDPSKLNIDPGDITKGVVKGSLSGLGDVAKLDDLTQKMCQAQFILKGTELLAMVARHRALASLASNIMVAAHQLKEGRGVTAGQISGLMALINRNPGIGASGSYQLLNGNKNAKVKNGYLYSLNLAKSGGVGGALATFNKKLDTTLDNLTLGNSDKYCGISRKGWYQVASTGVGLIVQVGGAILTGGASLAGTGIKVAASQTFSIGFNVVINIAQSIVSQSLSGSAAIIGFGPSQGGDKTVDAFAGGMLALSSAERYQNGIALRLSNQEVATIESKIALEKNEQLKSLSIFDKYFALKNTDSTLAKQLATMPSTPKLATQKSIASITNLPSKFIESLELLTPYGRAKAESAVANPYLVNNPLDIPMYGYPEEILELQDSPEFDIQELSEWVGEENSPIHTEYKDWVNKCFPKDPSKSNLLWGLPADEDQETLLNEICTAGSGTKLAQQTQVIDSSIAGNNYTGVAGVSTYSDIDKKYLKFATYHLDRTIQQGILFMSGKTDCNDPDSEDWDCAYVGNINSNNPNSAGTFRVATFNVLGDQHTEPGKAFEEYPPGPERMEKAFALIKDNGFAVVGLQELERVQRDKLIELAGTEWSIHPKNADYSNYRSSNSIIWKNSEFTLVNSDYGYDEELYYFNSRPLHAPWVRLKHKSGAIIYIKNTHDPANVGGNFAELRYKNAQRHYADAIEKIGDGEKVIVLGDFNSAEKIRSSDSGLTRNQLTYCVITNGGSMYNAFDTARGGPAANCPTTNNQLFHIDHIYHSRDLKVNRWDQVSGLDDLGISDHPAVYSDIVIESPQQLPSLSGWSWPIAKDTNISLCFNEMVNHPVYKKRLPHPGIDFSGDKLPTYAANSGIVEKAGKDSQNTIVIKHEGGLWSVYEHMSRIDVEVGQTVKSGQPIGLTGNVGFSTGPHLHFGITTDPKDYFYATMGENKLYNPLVFINDNKSFGKCNIEPRRK